MTHRPGRIGALALVITALAGSLVAAGQNRPPADRIARVEAGLLAAFVAQGRPAGMSLADRMKHYSVPGVSVAVINNGVIEWAKGYGVIEAGGSTPVTTETLFQAASISKPVAAMGMLALVEQGRLNLDEDVNLKFKSWKVPENDFTAKSKVTLRPLSSHSAGTTVHGFRGYAEGEPVPTVVQILDGMKPANSAAVRVDLAPGAQWRYSGGGITVMQLLMTDVTGRPFPALMKDLVFDRLGMTSSTYEQPVSSASIGRAAAGHRATGAVIAGKRHTYPEMAAAGLWTTPTDLASFAVDLQQTNAGKSAKVLSTAMANQMLTKQSGEYGLGIGLGGSGQTAWFSHGGSNVGFKCVLFAYVQAGQGAVVMTNGDQGSPLAGELLRSVSREYGWTDHKAREVAVVSVSPATLRAYAGTYQVNGVVNVTTENGTLFVQPPGGPRIEVLPLSETEFQFPTQDIKVRFVKDPQGQVNEIAIVTPGGSQQGKRIK